MHSENFPLAERMVVDLFGPLIGARGKLQQQHMWALQGMMQPYWSMEAEGKKEWLQRVRAALHLLENGCNMHPKELAPLVYDNLEQIGPIQMEISNLTKEMWVSEQSESNNPDKRFGAILGLYATLYEKFYPILVAPLIAADALLRTKVPIDQLIHPNGRAKHKAIEDLEIGRNYPRGLLTDGLQRHMRNSISHRHFKILSSEMIRMEDRKPATGKITWGPVDYIHSDLRDFVLKFLYTCDALVAALIIFDANNNEVLTTRGFIKHKPRRMRLDIAEIHFRSFAEVMGFSLISMREIDFSTLEVTIKILGERQESPEEIYVGGKGWAKHYTRKVHTEEIHVRNQVYGLIQHTLNIHDAYEWLVLILLRSDDSRAGVVKSDRTTRQAIFEGKNPIVEVRALVSEDTLPEEKMPVVLRELPKQI